jgi:hypothetical protein
MTTTTWPHLELGAHLLAWPHCIHQCPQNQQGIIEELVFCVQQHVLFAIPELLPATGAQQWVGVPWDKP